MSYEEEDACWSCMSVSCPPGTSPSRPLPPVSPPSIPAMLAVVAVFVSLRILMYQHRCVCVYVGVCV